MPIYLSMSSDSLNFTKTELLQNFNAFSCLCQKPVAAPGPSWWVARDGFSPCSHHAGRRGEPSISQCSTPQVPHQHRLRAAPSCPESVFDYLLLIISLSPHHSLFHCCVSWRKRDAQWGIRSAAGTGKICLMCQRNPIASWLCGSQQAA